MFAINFPESWVSEIITTQLKDCRKKSSLSAPLVTIVREASFRLIGRASDALRQRQVSRSNVHRAADIRRMNDNLFEMGCKATDGKSCSLIGDRMTFLAGVPRPRAGSADREIVSRISTAVRGVNEGTGRRDTWTDSSSF